MSIRIFAYKTAVVLSAPFSTREKRKLTNVKNVSRCVFIYGDINLTTFFSADYSVGCVTAPTLSAIS